MSVTNTHYILIGVRLSDVEQRILRKHVEENDLYDEYCPKGDGLTGIFDGMNGEYIFIGKVLHEGDDYEGFPIIDCVKAFQDNYETVKRMFWEHPLFKTYAGKEISIYVFTHCH